MPPDEAMVTKQLHRSSRIPVIKVSVVVLTVLGLHVSIAFNWAVGPIVAIVASILVALGLNFHHDRRWQVSCLLLIALCVFGGALGLHLHGFAGVDRILATPSFVVLGAVSAVFGHSLMRGREPIVVRFMKIQLGIVPDLAAKYGRRLTLIWAGLLAAMSIESLVLGIYADLGTWSWLVNVVNPAILIAFFIGQHMIGRRYLPEHRDASPLSTFRAMLEPAAWLRGSRQPRH